MHAPSSVVALTAAAVIAAALMTGRAMSAARPEPAPLPQRLSDTGLFEPGTATPRVGVLAFAPQYPLWSDGRASGAGSHCRRAARSTRRSSMHGSFPPARSCGRSSASGGAIETRYIERLADGSWRFATYVWNAAGTEATLAPDDGIRASPSPARRAVATPFLRAPTAWRATKALRCRCLASVRCSCRPIAIRWRRTPTRRALRCRSALACRARLVAQPAAGIARSSAAHRCAVANRARRAGLSARQLRPLPQRRPVR